MNTLKGIIYVLVCIFLISLVSLNVSLGKSGDEEAEEDFLEEEFGDDEFDDDDELFDFDEEEEMKPPVKKAPKKAPKKEVKKKKKKESKKKAEKKKAARKYDITEFDDDDLFDFEEEEGVEAVPVKKEQKPEEEIIFKVYKAKKNDTLYTIAEKFYSDPDRWEEIWKYNKYIKDPTFLFKGDNVIVPVRVIKIKDEIESEELREVQKKIEKKYEKQTFFPGDVDYEGRILAIKNKDLMMPVSGNIVFVNIGSSDGVKPDMLYTVYHERGSVVKKVGVLRITEDIGENDSTALIVSSFDPINVGDFILRRK